MVERASRTIRALRAAGAVGAVTFVLLFAGPGAPAAASPGESISRYDARIQVSADGQLRVTETISYDFGSDGRHGIVRTIPAAFRYDDRHDRVYPIDTVTVTMDGSSVPVERSTQDGSEAFKIGDPDRTITGVHTYVIGYTVRGVLNHFPDHEELYWNAVGGEWSVPIDHATAEVTGPAAIQRAECFAGPTGSLLGCDGKSVDGTTAIFRQSGLGNGSGLSVVVAFPPGSVSAPGPILVDRHDLTTAFRVTPATVGGAVGVALLGVGGALAIAWRVGRDRRYVGTLPGLVPEHDERAVEERKPLTGAPPVSVEFVPPENVRPGQVGTLIDERANVVDVTATIVDFAVRRHLHIRELRQPDQERPQDWELTKLTKGDPKFRWYEGTLFSALFKDRDSVRLSELKGTFAADLARVQRELYADMVNQGWYRQSPATTRTAARTVAALIALASVAITILLALLTPAGLVGLGLVAGSIALLAVAGRFPARTGKGSAALARVQGFRLYVATTEAEQIKFQEREKIFSEYLPYAMVFGLTDRWARIFADLATTGPGLYWYAGNPGWTMAYFGQSVQSFTLMTAGTIASTPPSVAGTSGFSGGGFSGGGAGGGGGGSW